MKDGGTQKKKTGACWHLVGVGLENGTAVSVGAGLMESTVWDYFPTLHIPTGNQIKPLEHHLLSADLATVHHTSAYQNAWGQI